MQLFASTEPSELMPSGCSDRIKVGGGSLRTKYRGYFPKIAAAFAAVLTLSACASSSDYMGISLKPGATTPELQDLARRAQAGDKQAQLELGIAYEEGRGVLVDLPRAKQLYTLAASDSGGTIWVYSPPVGNGTKGRVIPMERGPKLPGIEEARQRLAALIAKVEGERSP